MTEQSVKATYLPVHIWLTYGEKDLEAARTLYRAGHYMACAFHCHQVVEKALKALWTELNEEEPPRIHNLRLLLTHLNGCAPPEHVVEAVLELNPHYVTARMPGWPPHDIDMYTHTYARKLLQLTEDTWTWCLQTLNSTNN
ncbi:MAG: HEPN domain-containing protein [Chloroflexi bacterium]|nr:HEPN domain-containing protein [Chloroflexota bacterium]